MDAFLPESYLKLREDVSAIARTRVAGKAAEVDRGCLWPAHTLAAMAEAGLTGLHVPRRLGGREEGLLALALACEAIGEHCSSSALCFGMHCVGSAVIAAKATPYHEEKYLRPIAEGKHLTTLALSEPGTGVHFYLPQCGLEREGDHFVVNGRKQFVTNGGHVDSYVLSTRASSDGIERGEFNCLLVDKGLEGMRWQGPWRGFGMRGNSSCALDLEGVRVPAANLLGEEGDQVWYAFEVVAPYFLVAMAGTYLGVAQAALDIAQEHLNAREFKHAGTALADVPVLQSKLAESWIRVTKTRGLIYQACHLGDLGDPQALLSILASKADAGDTAEFATNEAMTLCGGIGYAENGKLARLLRDARACHVMAPSTTVLKEWVGKALLGLPLL